MLPPTSTQHSWNAPDGATFSYSHWAAHAEPRAVLIAIHGLSGAALDYEPLGGHLAPLGFSTYAPELRGQGNDPVPARRGDLDRIENLVCRSARLPRPRPRPASGSAHLLLR